MLRAIYRLHHNQSERGLVGYIGKDTRYPKRVNLAQRAKNSHHPKLFAALNKYPLKLWHVDILETGFEDDKSLSLAEVKWIAEFDSKNKGYNCTDGGEGLSGYQHSLETRKRISESNRVAQTGKHHTEETKNRMSLAHIGHSVSEETRRKMSEKKMSVESREKIREANKRRIVSNETKQKLSLAAQQRTQSAETKNKISVALKGNRNALKNRGRGN